MRILLVSSLLSTALLAGCTGDIDDGTTTEFGDAVAITERADNGDISSVLTTPNSEVMLGSLDWRAADASLVGQVGDEALDIAGALQLERLPNLELNLLIYKLWEVERSAPEVATCVSNEALICCRSSAWSCRARL